MKVITVIQPWATLIALGEKKLETRSWATKHRGELAIHASKKVDKELCKCEPFRSILDFYMLTTETLPIGVIVATCKLVECHKITENAGTCGKLEIGYEVRGNEFFFGDYSAGRFAWELIEVKQLATPIPAKGQLNLWNYPLEAEISV